MQVTTARLTDGTGFAIATWFGRRYIERRVRAGDELLLSGKVKHRNGDLVFEGPEFQPADAANLLHVGRIVPVYRLTSGLTANRLRGAMRVALDRAGHDYPEYLPDPIRAAEDVPPIGEALEHAHYPTTFETRDAALRRLALDELLALQLGMVARRRARGRARTPGGRRGRRGRRRGSGRRSRRRSPGSSASRRRSPATRRRRSTRSATTSPGPSRCCASSRATSARARRRSRRGPSPPPRSTGGRRRCSRPTDLLARQHHATLTSLLEDLGLPTTLLTGSLSGEGRRNATEALASGQAAIVVGTHALLQDKVAFADLALAVVDEQHRFGVEQRGALEAKATRGAPHVLLMTATPIPRTLGQVLYADLDVSTLRTPPAGRVPIRTGIRRPGRPRGHLAARARRGGGGPADVRGRAAHRRRDRERDRRRAATATTATCSRATTSCPTRTSRRRGPRRPRSSTSG